MLTKEKAEWAAKFCGIAIADIGDSQPGTGAARSNGAAAAAPGGAVTGEPPSGAVSGPGNGAAAAPPPGTNKGAGPAAQPTLDDLIKRDPTLANTIRDLAQSTLFGMAYSRIGDSCGDYRDACNSVLGELKEAAAEADKAASATIQAVFSLAIFIGAPALAAIVSKVIPAVAAQISTKVVNEYLKSASAARLGDQQVLHLVCNQRALAEWLTKGFDHRKAEQAIEAGWHACKEMVEIHVGATENESAYRYLKQMTKWAEEKRNALQKAIADKMLSYSESAMVLGALQDSTSDGYVPHVREQLEHYKKEVAPVLEQVAHGGPTKKEMGNRRQGESMEMTTDRKFVRIMMHNEWRVAQIVVNTLDTGYGDSIAKNFVSWVDDDVIDDIGSDPAKLEVVNLKELKGDIPPPPRHRKENDPYLRQKP